MRYSTSSCLLFFVGLYCASSMASTFPPIIDTRINTYEALQIQTPVFIPSEGEYSYDLLPIEDIDNDGTADHILYISDESFYYLDSDSITDEAASCQQLYLVPSSTIGSSFVLSDVVEITGLEVLFDHAFDPYSSYSYAQPELVYSIFI